MENGTNRYGINRENSGEICKATAICSSKLNRTRKHPKNNKNMSSLYNYYVFCVLLIKTIPFVAVGVRQQIHSFGVRLLRERASMVLTCAHTMVMYNISVFIYIYMIMYNYSFMIYIYRIRIPILTSIFCAWGETTRGAFRQIGETVRVIQCFRSDGTLLLGNDEVFFSPED